MTRCHGREEAGRWNQECTSVNTKWINNHRYSWSRALACWRWINQQTRWGKEGAVRTANTTTVTITRPHGTWFCRSSTSWTDWHCQRWKSTRVTRGKIIKSCDIIFISKGYRYMEGHGTALTATTTGVHSQLLCQRKRTIGVSEPLGLCKVVLRQQQHTEIPPLNHCGMTLCRQSLLTPVKKLTRAQLERCCWSSVPIVFPRWE